MLTLKLSDYEIVEPICRHRWPNGVKCPYCSSPKVCKNGKAPRRLYLQRYIWRNSSRLMTSGTLLTEARIPPSTVLAILYFYYMLGLSQSAVAREFGKNLETWFHLPEA